MSYNPKAKMTPKQLIKQGGDIGYMSPQARALARTGGLETVMPMKKKMTKSMKAIMKRKKVSKAAEIMMGGK